MKYDPNTLTVTSANRKIMKDYGKDTLPTIIKNSPGDVLVCYDGKEPDIIEGDWVRMLSLDNDKELKSFVERNKGTEGNGFRYDAVKFAWKVFSLYHGFKIAQQTEKEHLIWCDADTYITDKITNVEVENQIEGYDIAWLDRPNFTHGETGFIVFSTFSPWTEFLIEWMYHLYTSDNLFMLREWHDAYAMSFIIWNCQAVGMQVNNMNSATSGTEAVGHSPFKHKMKHIK